jgi:ABC-type Fe3+ transport system substrate-binding protein
MSRLVALAGVVVVALAACGGVAAPAASSPPAGVQASATGEMAQLIEGARKEGQLVFAWSDNTIGSATTFGQYADAFNRLYGLDLKIQFTPAESMPAMGAKIAQEVQAGRPASSDVFLGTAENVRDIMSTGALQAVDWSWAPNLKDASLIEPGNIAVNAVTLLPGIAYNSSKLKGDAVPKTLEHLLKPEYKGRIASTVYAAQFNRLAAPELWGEQKTVDYVTKLSQQVSGLIRCGEQERIANGEFDLLALDCGADADRLKAHGAPVDHVIPTDAPMFFSWDVAVPKNTAHPNGAKLWVNFALGRQAQDLIYKDSFADNAFVPGSHIGPQLDAIKQRGAKPIKSDLEFYQRNDPAKLKTVSQQLVSILQKK